MSNLVNAERVTMSYGVRILLEDVSLGLGRRRRGWRGGSQRIGKDRPCYVFLAETVTPDSGRITHTGHLSIGFLDQIDDPPANVSVRDFIVGGAADHVWAANP
jgi:ATPase subunit of ABC transporter with duplicated ATPase domains